MINSMWQKSLIPKNSKIYFIKYNGKDKKGFIPDKKEKMMKRLALLVLVFALAFTGVVSAADTIRIVSCYGYTGGKQTADGIIIAGNIDTQSTTSNV